MTTTTVATGRWAVVSSLTSAGFAVGNLGGLMTVHGTIPVTDASITVDKAGTPTAVRAVLDVSSIATGIDKRDTDLRKPKLLDTAKYPTLVFECADVRPADDTWELHGTLHGRGTTTELVLTASACHVDDDGALRVHATTTFDRRELGVRAPRFLIGTQLAITIDATFAPPAN